MQTRAASLSRLMRHLNGVYTQAFNRRHRLVGHVLQGRFKAILLDTETYLVALCRYVERNRVAAGLVASPEEWPWSSCRAHVGATAAPEWFDVDTVHACVLQRPPRGSADRRRAAARYAQIVADGDLASPWDGRLLQQVFLGDEGFVKRALSHADPTARAAPEVPKQQRRAPQAPMDLVSHLRRFDERDLAIHAAYREGGFTMTRLAAESGLSVSRVSRVIAAVEVRIGQYGERARGKT